MIVDGFLNKPLTGRRPIETPETEINRANVLKVVMGKAEPIHLLNKNEIRFLHNYYLGSQPVLHRTKEYHAEITNRIVENQVAGEAELYFQNALYLIFKIMGFHTQVEIPTSDGRMDVLIQTSDYIYIIECKLDGSAEEALQQIEAKNYAAPFAMDKRTVVKLGINFTSKTRGVESWKQR